MRVFCNERDSQRRTKCTLEREKVRNVCGQHEIVGKKLHKDTTPKKKKKNNAEHDSVI